MNDSDSVNSSESNVTPADVLLLVEHGIPVLPTEPGLKHPGGRFGKWEKHQNKPADQLYQEKYETWATPGYGAWAILGHHFVVLDIDSPAALTLWEQRLGPGILDRTACVDTDGGFHFWFRLPAGVSIKQFTWNSDPEARQLDAHYDLKSTGGGVMVPPSLHPGHSPSRPPIPPGFRYTWVRDLSHVLPLPPEIQQIANAISSSNGSSRDGGKGLAGLLQSPSPNGDRNFWVTEVCGHLAKVIPFYDGYMELVHLAADRHFLPFEISEIDRTANSIWNAENSKTPTTDDAYSLLGLETVRVVADRVDAAAPIEYLFEGVWPGDAYGVVGAKHKVGKTWLQLDAAVSAASATPWLGTFGCSLAGVVVIFAGEGGERKMLRRGRAIAAARGLVWEDLPIYIAHRPLKMTDQTAMASLTVVLDNLHPSLVIVDPLYLSVGNADSTNLNQMGEALSQAQLACQTVGSALMVVHHHNRDTSRSDSERLSGAGPAEWARVIHSVTATSINISPEGRSDVNLTVVVEGDEVAGGEWFVKRSVWADDPEDLQSTLNYEMVQMDAPTAEQEKASATENDLVVMALQYLLSHPGKTKEEVAAGIRKRRREVAKAMDNARSRNLLTVEDNHYTVTRHGRGEVLKGVQTDLGI